MIITWEIYIKHSIKLFQKKLLCFVHWWELHVRTWYAPGAYEGGRAPGPPYSCPLWGGDSWGGGSFNITSSSGNLHSTLSMCIALAQTKRLRKELKDILIYNNTLQSFVWSSIALKIRFPFWTLNIFIFGFSTKVTRACLASETMEK